MEEHSESETGNGVAASSEQNETTFGILFRLKPMPKHDAFDLVFLFAVAGLIGTLYEEILTLCVHGVIEDRSGSILTPFNPVYGMGAIAIFLTMSRIKKPQMLFLAGAIVGGCIEFSFSLFQEYVFGSCSWDYSMRFLNIGGRTTLPYMLVWGLLCFLAIRFVFPCFLRFIHRFDPNTRKRFAVALLGFMACDAVITTLAEVRFSQRAEGVYFANWVLSWIDVTFNDAFMQAHFPTMVLVP